MSAWVSYAATAAVTGLLMGVAIVGRYGGAAPEAAFAALDGAADPVVVGSIVRPAAGEGPARPRRFPQSAFSPGEISVPPPSVRTTTMRFAPAGGASEGPAAGRFSPAPEMVAETAEPARRGKRVSVAALDPEADETVGGAARPRDVTLGRSEAVDGRTLGVEGGAVRLDGLVLPAEGQACPMLDGTPAGCRERARTQLELFVRHRPVVCALPTERPRGTVEGRCRIGTADSAEWLVRSGWARAAAGAEPRLVTAMAEAKRRRLGIWRF